VPEDIPHLSSPVGNANNGVLGGPTLRSGSIAGLPAGSPVKESSFLNRETSADEVTDEAAKVPSPVGGQKQEGIPIRR